MIVKYRAFLIFAFVFVLFSIFASNVRAIDAVDVAAAQIGKPYISGDSGPDSFDCSGLTQYSYAQVGITLPKYSGDQAEEGTLVTGILRRGDLLFYAMEEGEPDKVSHVGIYEGGNIMINAVSPSLGIRRDDITDKTLWLPHFLFARRIINYNFYEQLNFSVLDTASRGNPVQLLGTNLSGTLSSLKIKYQGGGASSHYYYLLILEYQDNTYNRFTRTEYWADSVKPSSGTSVRTDEWASSDFTNSITFNPNKYYGFMLYQLDGKPFGSGGDNYPEGCYVKEEPSSQFVTCDPSNIEDMYFELKLTP